MPKRTRHLSEEPDAPIGGDARPPELPEPDRMGSGGRREITVISHNVHTLLPLLDHIAQPRLPFPSTPSKRLKTDNPASSSSKPSTPWNPVINFIKHHQPHLICLQEIKSHSLDRSRIPAIPLVSSRTHTGLSAATQRYGYQAYTSLSRTKAKKGGRNYAGVVTYVRNDVEVKGWREVEWDDEGRVVVVELEGLVVYNVYALNGSEAPWTNTKTGKVEGTRNERKRAFNTLLAEDIKTHYPSSFTSSPPSRSFPSILLIGDFNISLAPLDCIPRLRTEYPHSLARSHFRDEILPSLNMVDAFRALHPEKRSFSWFERGKEQGVDAARVDYPIVQRRMVEVGGVKEVVYLEGERGESDHCPVKITVFIDRGAIGSDELERLKP